jgi:biotin carboxylase
MATFLAVGAGFEQRPYILKARAIGHHVVAVDGRPGAPGLDVASKAVVVDIRDASTVTDIASSSHCSAILPMPVGAVLDTVGRVNDALHLRGPSHAAICQCTDKFLFFRTARRANVVVPETVLVESRDEAIAAAERLGFPVVLKPRRGSGSKGVFMVSDIPELLDALAADKTSAGNLGEECLVQQAACGREVGVDGIVVSDTPHVLLVRDKVLTPPPARFAMEYFAPTDLPVAHREAVATTVIAAARALGFTDCLFHADVIVDAVGQPWILEMAPRPSGFNLFISLLPAVTGRDVAADMIEFLAGGRPPPTAVSPQAHAMLSMIDARCAEGFQGLSPHDFGDSVAEIVLQSGHRASPTTPPGFMYGGHILTIGPSREAARRHMSRVFAQAVSDARDCVP